MTGVTMDAANTSLLVMSYPLKGFNGVREHSLFYREHKLRTKCIHYLFHIGFASAEVEAIMGKKNNAEAIKTLLRHIDCLLNSGVDRDEVLNVLSQSRGAKMLELINEN